MSTPETAYTEDDTPRRFRELLQRSTATRNKGSPAFPPKDGVVKVDDEWVVRPGETFREFNARIRQSGLTVPPGVSEATRYPCEPHTRPSTRDPLPAKRFAVSVPSDSAVVPGERTKQKRKEYLKQRREAKRLKRHKTRAHSDDEDDGGGASAGKLGSGALLHTRDMVQAPPTLRVTPKATLKITSRRSPHQKNPSLLPLVRTAKRT